MATNRNPTPAHEDYLMALLRLGRDGRCVPTTELAEFLSVRKPSISGMLKKLGEAGLVDYVPRGGARLSRRGRAAGLKVLRRHRLLETYLVEKLGLDWSEVHEEADVLEHHVSDRIVEAMDRALGYPTEDPHGRPIPDTRGRIASRDLTPLRDLETGQTAIVREVRAEDADRLRRWKDLGLVPGARVEMRAREDMEDMLHLRVSKDDIHTSPKGIEGIMVDR